MPLFLARSAAAVAALLGLAAPGLAQTPAAAPVIAAPAPVAPSSDWTGFYAGGQLSFGSLSIEDAEDEYDGALYGVHGGYQRDFGRFVLGAEASYDFTDITIDDAADVDSVARVGLRAGYDAGRFLPYLTVGFARTSLSAEVADDESADDDESYDGGYAGIGVSYSLTERLDLGAEVLQHRFDADDSDLDMTTVGVRASYRF